MTIRNTIIHIIDHSGYKKMDSYVCLRLEEKQIN